MKKTIFVSIVSYRDADIQNTVNDLFSTADEPGRVFVGIYLQIDNNLDKDCLVLPRPNIRIETVDASISKGAGWARSKVQALWRGEDYFFQVDSHMRFAKGWDSVLCNMIKECPSDKPVISTYPLPFSLPRNLNQDRYVTIKPKIFDTDGVMLQNSGMVEFLPEQSLFQSAFISAGMLFSSASVISEVPYDEHIFFTGEEITMGIRLWTHGYDIFVPNKVVAYHNYEPSPERPRVWKDTTDQTIRSAQSRARVLWLCGQTDTLHRASATEIDKYGLGKLRSLEEYESFSKVDFKNRLYKGEKLLP